MIQIDTRVIASTNRNLEVALSNDQFREDLYHRLNVVQIYVPPLRERKEEIPILANYFLNKFNQRREQRVDLPPETLTLFTEYPWPAPRLVLSGRTAGALTCAITYARVNSPPRA